MVKRFFYLIGWVIYFPIFITLAILMFGGMACYGVYDFIVNGTDENAFEWFDKVSNKLLELY